MMYGLEATQRTSRAPAGPSQGGDRGFESRMRGPVGEDGFVSQSAIARRTTLPPMDLDQLWHDYEKAAGMARRPPARVAGVCGRCACTKAMTTARASSGRSDRRGCF